MLGSDRSRPVITALTKKSSKEQSKEPSINLLDAYSIVIQPSLITILALSFTFTQPQAVLISTSEALV